jgi:hypothetical protein
LKRRLPSLTVSVERSVRANFAITAMSYLFMIASGGCWGIGAVYTYFAIEMALKAHGEGAVAAIFLPLFMAPWALFAGRTGMKLLNDWLDVLAPGRQFSN